VRAVLTTGHGGRDKLLVRRDFPDPIPKQGEVLVAIGATAVNFHDIFTRRGMPGIRIPLPIVAGSDIAGTIRSTGAGVSGWKPGQRVLIDPVFETGGKPGLIGETCDGGRAELIAVPANLLIPIPPAVTTVHAAALPLAYGTAFRMLVTQGSVAAGEKVLVLGASGGVGAACVQIARALGAEVIACASSDAKLARLEEAGAEHHINYAAENFAAAVRARFGKPRAIGGGGVDVAVNFTGGDTMLDTQRCVTKGGRILCCGATAGHNLAVDARYLWTFEHRMVGSDGWTREDLVTLLEWVATGRLVPLIDRTLALEEAAEGERLLEDREVVGKVVLCP
jgi:alcohol dehydrogenase